MSQTHVLETDERGEALLTIDHVRAAAGRIAGSIVHTPTLRSRTLSEITGANIWLKFENLQFTAAYKERGALNKLLLLTEEQRQARRDRRFGRQSQRRAYPITAPGWAYRSRS